MCLKKQVDELSCRKVGVSKANDSASSSVFVIVTPRLLGWLEPTMTLNFSTNKGRQSISGDRTSEKAIPKSKMSSINAGPILSCVVS